MGELVPQSPGPAPGQPAGPVLVTVGDMACTQTSVITPTGAYPLAGTTWIVANNTVTTESIPAYAIVMAIIFFLFCLLGLLFLLIKERKTQGYVQVSVQGPGVFHATQVPVSSPAQILDIEQRVNYVRSLVAALQRAR
ncbi:MAG TPA: hypothetical protein VGU71_01385 [Candidatus Dormibacteraeota bacterium]|nr:hypothetical protein [Candidatus Dormibacteraeota bacterium]